MNPFQDPIRRETGEIIGEKKELVRKRNQVTLTSDSFFVAIISPVAFANCVLKWVLSIHSSVVERFLDMEEVSGPIPLGCTRTK